MDHERPSLPWYPPLPSPSDIEPSRQPFPRSPPAFLVRAVLGMRRLLQRFTHAVAPAELAIFEMTTGVALTHMIGAVARFGIVDELAKGPATAAVLANRLGLDENALYRTLRALTTQGLFVMRSGERFENGRLAEPLLSGRVSRMREWALYFSSGSNVAAWGDFGETLRTGRSAFDRLHGMTVWEWFDCHPDEREIFAHVMMGLTASDAPVIAAIYPFGEIKTVCDVGGGRGTLLSEVLLRHPHLSGILAEGEGVLVSARELFAARGVTNRVALAAGNFFEEVPPGADGYLLKNILHDWNDETCRRLLAVVRRSACTGARVIVCEGLVENDSTDPLASMVDLQMMVACSNGKERGLADYKALLSAAGFQYTRHFRHPTIAVIEGVSA